MATPILTTRELRNEDTGIDITVPTYKEIPGLLSTTAEYHVIVISKLSYFKTPKHKDNDIVQFMVPKKYGDFEELHKTLDEMYSGTAFPELPKKTLLIKDSTVQERRRCFDRLMVFIAENHKVCCSPPVLEFLGVNPIKAGRYRKNIDVDVKPKKSQETTEKDEGTVKQPGDNDKDLFGEGEDGDDTDLFFDTRVTKEDSDDLFLPTSKLTNPEKVSSAALLLFEEQDLEMEPSMKRDQIFVPQDDDNSVKIVDEDEDTDELLTIEDDLDKLLKLDKATPKKSPKPQLLPKPKPPPKPTAETKNVAKDEKEDLFSMATGDASGGFGQDDIMKYIKDNTDEKEVTLDLF